MRRNIILISLLIILSFLFFIIDLLFGSVNIPYGEFIDIVVNNNSQSGFYSTISDFRLPKAIVATLAGAALAVSGLQMQTIFRNPLAGPYILGISSGAGLGVALLIIGFPGIAAVSYAVIFSQWAVAAAAWLGAALVLVVIMLVSIRIRDIMTILIFGMMFGSAASALISIMQYFGADSSVKSFVVWTMGNLGGVTNSQLQVMFPVITAGLLLVFLLPKNLNVLLLGENYARTMGLNVFRTRLLVFLSTSLLAGTVTAFCGPIGFIGIAVPHIARLVFRTANHFILIPGSVLLGVNVMLVSDIVSQLPGSGEVLPINSITALIGIPIVIWIIFRNQKISSMI
jgi:iron complex transport system permease protein